MKDEFSRLQTAAIDGVQFPLESMTRSGGRGVARHRYPYRDGQDVEDMGREPLRWSLQIPLFRGIDPALYPTRYEELRFVLDDPDTQGDVEFTDPELGPVPAKVISHSWALDAMARNGGRLTIELEERSSLPFIIREAMESFDTRSIAEAQAEYIDDNLPVSEGEVVSAWNRGGVPLVELEFGPGELFVTMVDDFFDIIETARIAADEAAEKVDRIRRRLDLVLAFSAMSEAKNWSIVQSVGQLQESISLAGERASQGGVRVISYVVPTPMSHYEIAAALYGDVARASEILVRNPQKEPMRIQAGVRLQVLNR